MKPIAFFKLQAKHLLEDYQTQSINTENKELPIFSYQPKFINIDSFIVAFDYEEVEASIFTLQKSQHIISMILGLNKWSELVNLPLKEQELLVQLYKSNINIYEWPYRDFDFDSQLEMLKVSIENRYLVNEVDYLINNF